MLIESASSLQRGGPLESFWAARTSMGPESKTETTTQDKKVSRVNRNRSDLPWEV
jgi:hypothetical protein